MLAANHPKVEPALPPLPEADLKVFESMAEAHRQYLLYLDEVDVDDLTKLVQRDEAGAQRPPRVDLPLTYDVR